MPQRRPDEPITPDAVATVLRRRRRRGGWLTAAAVGLVASAVWSHWRAPPDPSRWDGRAGITCERIRDGDTIVVTGPGLEPAEVRLRGIDAPDAGAYFASESRQYLAARLLAEPGEPPRPITLQFDGTEKRDADGRLFAYVYLGDSDCLNVDCVRDGMAYVDRRFKTVLQSTLDQIESQARGRGTGLWKNLAESDMPAWRRAWLEKLRSRASK